MPLLRFSIRPKFCFSILILLLFLYYFDSIYLSENEEEEEIIDSNRIKKLSSRVYDARNDSETKCILPNLDPWDYEIEQVFPNLDSKPKLCIKTLNQLTILENGVLKVNWERGLFSWFAPYCHYRCLYPDSDWNITQTEWKLIDNDRGVKPNCDIIETQCERYFWYNYRFLHTQFVEKFVFIR